MVAGVPVEVRVGVLLGVAVAVRVAVAVGVRVIVGVIVGVAVPPVPLWAISYKLGKLPVSNNMLSKRQALG